MSQSIRDRWSYWQKKRDPYLEILHVGAIAIVALLINGLIFIAFQPVNFLMVFILGVLGVTLCNLPFYSGKKEKIMTVLYMYVLSVIAYFGVVIVSVNMAMTVSYFFFLSFFFYLTTLCNSLYRLHVSAVLTLSAVLVHLSNGTLEEALMTSVSVTIVFAVVMLLTLCYPERLVERIELGICYILSGMKQLVATKELTLCRKQFYELSKHIIQLGKLFNQVDLKDEKIKHLEGALQNLRYTLLAMNIVYAKGDEENDLYQLNQKLGLIFSQLDSVKETTLNQAEPSIVLEAITRAEINLKAFFNDYQNIIKKENI